MIPGIWTRWSHELPPPDIEVETRWGELDTEITLGKRCKRGCCFRPSSHGEACVPPTWWRLPEHKPGEQK